MNRMTRMTMTVLSVALMASSVMAQDADQVKKDEKATTEQRESDKTDKMSEDLGLSSDQAARVKEINKNFMEQKKAAKEKAKAEQKEMREAHKAAIKGVLTAEQYAKWEAMKKEKQGDRKEHMKEGRDMKEQKDRPMREKKK